jgi:hypothetical protein
LVLGKAPADIFCVRFGDLVPIGGVNVKFNDLSVAAFKEVLSKKEQTKGINAMNVWKVELDLCEIGNIFTEDHIKNHNKSEKIDDNPMLKFNKYYNNNVDEDKKPKEEYLHIFIVPTSIGKCLLMVYLSNKKIFV